MRTQMAETSLSARKSLSNKYLSEREIQFLAVLRDGVPKTRFEIAVALDWRDGKTTSTCDALIAKGAIHEDGEKLNPVPGGKMAKLLHITKVQRELFN